MGFCSCKFYCCDGENISTCCFSFKAALNVKYGGVWNLLSANLEVRIKNIYMYVYICINRKSIMVESI